MAAPVELAAEDDSGADAGSDREKDEVVDAAGDPAPLLAQGGEVDVVLEPDRQVEGALQFAGECSPLEACDVLGQPEQAGSLLHHAGDPDHHPVDPVSIETRGLEQRRA